MIEEVAPNLFKLKIKLHGLPLGSVNSYVIKDSGRSLIIDTGLYNDLCFADMKQCLDQIGVDLKDADFFITHCHGDHVGLVYMLAQPGCVIHIDEQELQVIHNHKEGIVLAETETFLRLSGFPEQDPEKVFFKDIARHFKTSDALPFVCVNEGDWIEKGSYRFQIVRTPGHSRGHLCLYEPDKKMLIGGDHILEKITPGIPGRVDGSDPLRDYLASLDKIDQLDVETILPGHGRVFGHCRQRIEEIREHHREREREVLEILQSGSMSIFEIAGQVKWNIKDESWESLPLIQQYHAALETYAHLIYLENTGKVFKTIREDVAFYSLCSTLKSVKSPIPGR